MHGAWLPACGCGRDGPKWYGKVPLCSRTLYIQAHPKMSYFEGGFSLIFFFNECNIPVSYIFGYLTLTCDEIHDSKIVPLPAFWCFNGNQLSSKMFCFSEIFWQICSIFKVRYFDMLLSKPIHSSSLILLIIQPGINLFFRDGTGGDLQDKEILRH